MRSIAVQTFAIGLMLISQAIAAPLEEKQVAAKATWLVHVDIDAIRASTIVQKAWQKLLEKHPELEANLGFVRIVMGTDPARDIHGITIYDKGSSGPQAVAIVAALMDPERITLLSGIIPGRETTMHGDYAIHCWTPRYHNHTLTIAAAFRGHEQLLLASSVDDIKEALDVLDGKVPGLAADARLRGNIPPGTTFLMRAEGRAEAGRSGKTPGRMPIDSFRMVMGENDGQSFVRLRATMTTPGAVAYTLTAIHSGQALCNLVCSDELGRKFVNAVQSKSDGPTVTLQWSVPADDIWDGLLRIEKAIKTQIARLRSRDKHNATDTKEDEAPAQQETPAKKAVPSNDDF